MSNSSQSQVKFKSKSDQIQVKVKSISSQLQIAGQVTCLEEVVISIFLYSLRHLFLSGLVLAWPELSCLVFCSTSPFVFHHLALISTRFTCSWPCSYACGQKPPRSTPQATPPHVSWSGSPPCRYTAQQASRRVCWNGTSRRRAGSMFCPRVYLSVGASKIRTMNCARSCS